MPNRIYHNASSGLEPFAPSGDPENLNGEGSEKPSDEVGANAKLAELGAGLTKARKFSSLAANAQKIDIPKEGQKSSYNDKP